MHVAMRVVLNHNKQMPVNLSPFVAPTRGSSGPLYGRRTGSIAVPSASKKRSSNQLPAHGSHPFSWIQATACSVETSHDRVFAQVTIIPPSSTLLL